MMRLSKIILFLSTLLFVGSPKVSASHLSGFNNLFSLIFWAEKNGGGENTKKIQNVLTYDNDNLNLQGAFIDVTCCIVVFLILEYFFREDLWKFCNLAKVLWKGVQSISSGLAQGNVAVLPFLGFATYSFYLRATWLLYRETCHFACATIGVLWMFREVLLACACRFFIPKWLVQPWPALWLGAIFCSKSNSKALSMLKKFSGLIGFLYVLAVILDFFGVTILEESHAEVDLKLKVPHAEVDLKRDSLSPANPMPLLKVTYEHERVVCIYWLLFLLLFLLLLLLLYLCKLIFWWEEKKEKKEKKPLQLEGEEVNEDEQE